MTTVTIPAWNPQGVLPPIDVLNPTDAKRSPYRVLLTDLVVRFATSPERRQILRGWLDYRARISKTLSGRSHEHRPTQFPAGRARNR